MWLFDTEQTEGVVIKHARNGRENRLPELPHFSVDGYLQRRIKFMSFRVLLARLRLSAVS